MPALSRLTSARWWWALGLLVVAPALALAVLGLWATRAERVQHEHQVLQRQLQTARLADAALGNRIGELESDLKQAAAAEGDAPSNSDDWQNDVISFERDGQGLIIFRADRVYVGDFGVRPETLATTPTWPDRTEMLFERALSAEARGRPREAAQWYAELAEIEPALRTWSHLGIARVAGRTPAAILSQFGSDGHDAIDDGISPQGLPVALLVSAEIERIPDTARTDFLPLIHQTLRGLRSGRWWMSYDERQFYDEVLRRLLISSDAAVRVGDDARLEELIAVARAARRNVPYRRDRLTRALVRDDEQPFLLAWMPRGTQGWVGAAVPFRRLQAMAEDILAALFSDNATALVVRDRYGTAVWGALPEGVAPIQTMSFRSLPEWEIAFGPVVESEATATRRLLWYGFVVALVLMLGTGITMTVRVVRREVELSRMQSEFVAAVSHEFKSPIVGIRLLIERLAGRRALDVDRYYGSISSELDRLDRLIGRLLVSQQIQAGRKTYRFERADLPHIARECIEALQPQADAKRVDLQLTVDGDLSATALDKAAITDAIENLVDNAIKYSPANTTVTVDLFREGDRVVIRVCDEGIGIAPDERERIFEKFYRGRTGDQQNVRGTGLGLALVRSAAEAHAGHVKVDSRPARGSCFTFTFPTNLKDQADGADSNR